jgi:NAD(P)-dependent dehydrogenase (short-subunit alcohol dehydrogenase family)
MRFMPEVRAQLRRSLDPSLLVGLSAFVTPFLSLIYSVDFGHKQITVNGIAPGGIKSDMYAEVARDYIPGAHGGPVTGEGAWPIEKIDQAMASTSPLNRVGVPNDVAKVVAFLASDDAGWINGQILTIGGGAWI